MASRYRLNVAQAAATSVMLLTKRQSFEQAWRSRRSALAPAVDAAGLSAMTKATQARAYLKPAEVVDPGPVQRRCDELAIDLTDRAELAWMLSVMRNVLPGIADRPARDTTKS